MEQFSIIGLSLVVSSFVILMILGFKIGVTVADYIDVQWSRYQSRK